MKRFFLVTISLAVLTGAPACGEYQDYEGTPLLTVQVDGEDKELLKVPIDLMGLEKKVMALTRDGGGGVGGMGSPAPNAPLLFTNGLAVNYSFTNSSGSAPAAFQNDDTVAPFYFSDDPVPTYFSGGGTCNYVEEACMFTLAVCQHMAPVIANFGDGPETIDDIQGQCLSIDCGRMAAEMDATFDQGFPADFKCALAAIFSCMTPQVPAVAAAMQSLGPTGTDDDDAFAALMGPIMSEVTACLGPYTSELQPDTSSVQINSGSAQSEQEIDRVEKNTSEIPE